MSIDDVHQVIVDELQKHGHTLSDDLCPCTTFDELDLDSLDKVELIQGIEDRVLNDVPREVYPRLQTLRDVAIVLADPCAA